MLCVCRLFGCRDIQKRAFSLSLVNGGADVPEYFARIAMFRVYEGFCLSVSICGNVAGSIKC